MRSLQRTFAAYVMVACCVVACASNGSSDSPDRTCRTFEFYEWIGLYGNTSACVLEFVGPTGKKLTYTVPAIEPEEPFERRFGCEARFEPVKLTCVSAELPFSATTCERSASCLEIGVENGLYVQQYLELEADYITTYTLRCGESTLARGKGQMCTFAG